MGSDLILAPAGELLGAEEEMLPQPAQLGRNTTRKGLTWDVGSDTPSAGPRAGSGQV